MGDREGAEEMKGETLRPRERKKMQKQSHWVIGRGKTSSQEEGDTRIDKKRIRAELPDCQGSHEKLRDASCGA